MRVTVSVPDELGQQVQKWADKQEASVSSIYAEAVESYLDERRRLRAVKRIDQHLDGAFTSDALSKLQQSRRKSERLVE